MQLLNDLRQMLESKEGKLIKPWLKNSEVRKLLNISSNTIQRLRTAGKLRSSKVGGIHYLSSLDSCTPSAANAPYYIEILEEQLARRRMLDTADQLSTAVRASQRSNSTAIPECNVEMATLDPTHPVPITATRRFM